jgi:ribosomal protein S18 acetylase RimI-like enzyme
MTLIRRLLAGGNSTDAEVVPLSVAEASRLRTSIVARFTPEMLAHQVSAYPDLAFRVEGEGQYALGGLWRRRDEIGEVVEVSRGANRGQLLRRLLEAFDARGVALVVLDFEEGAGRDTFYSEMGFESIERIVEYDRRIGPIDQPSRAVEVRPFEPRDFDSVLEVDHDSFPWLWWNSAAELDGYLEMPGVRLFVSLDGGQPVGYAGVTVRGTFAHLDRLAVRVGRQSRGHGASLLTVVLEHLESIGVRRIALSTQENNYRSQALYERFGFTRGRWTYDIRGLWLREIGFPAGA